MVDYYRRSSFYAETRLQASARALAAPRRPGRFFGHNDRERPSRLTYIANGRINSTLSVQTLAAGTGMLTVQAGGTVNIAGTLKVWGPGTVLLDDGLITTGDMDVEGTLSGRETN